MKLGFSRAQYYADPGRYRVCILCQLRAWDVYPEEWDAGLGLIARTNELLHSPGESLTDTIRADIVCVISHAAKLHICVTYRPE